MSQQFDAIFENGVFRPERPVNIRNGSRVSLTLNATSAALPAELADEFDLLDVEYMEGCRNREKNAPSLEATRKALSVYGTSRADLIGKERDER